ncbi:MAG: hypothetical protein KF855_01300 [Acidobacteria bacterium]|nr:hypothetical protein [Acidobacteriota bacterium]
MAIKLTVLVIFAMFFMDPCAHRPRRVELKDVPEDCKIENRRFYVRLSGKLHNTGEVMCGDAPGGRKCDIWLADRNGENQVKASVRMVVRKDDVTRWASVIIVPQAPADVAAPFSVKFEDILIYDRVGNLKDHTKETIDLSGALVVDSGTQVCSLRVMYIESDTADN